LIPEEYGGGNKYRLIWAPSRLITLTGRNHTMTVPMYFGPHAIEPRGECWILEKWLAPDELYRGTKEEWEADPKMLNLGPYPARGDYACAEALSVNPSDANIEKLITWIEAGRKRRAGDNHRVCVDNLEADLKARRQLRRDMLGDAMRPFGGADPMSGYGGGRNSKTAPLVYSREDLGLPDAGATLAINQKNAPMYEIPQEA
jgi:hypothetical protein